MKSASRSTGVALGGIGGLAVGGPVGAVSGGIAGGAAMDGIITGELNTSRGILRALRPKNRISYSVIIATPLKNQIN